MTMDTQKNIHFEMNPCDGTKLERLERNNWQSLWVTGSIGPLDDVEGVVQIAIVMHSFKQQSRSPWRWDVINQEFPFALGDERITGDQKIIVLDWLVKEGLAQSKFLEEEIAFQNKRKNS